MSWNRILDKSRAFEASDRSIAESMSSDSGEKNIPLTNLSKSRVPTSNHS
jgi:hypothetical protein